MMVLIIIHQCQRLIELRIIFFKKILQIIVTLIFTVLVYNSVLIYLPIKTNTQ
jgi:hypothetical protein